MFHELPVGEFFALGAAICWTATYIFFQEPVRKFPASLINVIRIGFATALLGGSLIVLNRSLVLDAAPGQFLYLALSGILGLLIADYMALLALKYLGPRLALLIFASAPVFSTIFGVLILGERLEIYKYLAILIVLVGIVIVVREKQNQNPDNTRSDRLKGITFALISTSALGVGLVISKYGMINAAPAGKTLDPMQATFIRMISAFTILFIWVIFTGKLKRIIIILSEHKTTLNILRGSFAGDYLGVWLSMLAVTYIAVGIASTLMSLMPIFIIPAVYILYREHTNLRGIIGTVITFCGVAVLFLS